MDRKAMGIGILEGWFDGSLILVTESLGVQVPSFGEKLVLWSGPLAPEVWGICVAAALVVGAAYWLIENKEDGSDLDRDSSSHNAIVSFFGSMLLFTGGGGPAPAVRRRRRTRRALARHPLVPRVARAPARMRKGTVARSAGAQAQSAVTMPSCALMNTHKSS